MIDASNKKFWKNKKVFITGHTGFKGSWLCLFLNLFGADIIGYSLKPERKSLYSLASIKKILKKSYLNDIRDYSKLKSAINNSKPDIIFHLAAQPLVIESYKDPVKTYETNIMGTTNLLEVIKNSKNRNLKSVIIITTDKVYEVSKKKVYKESDNLGSSDPYSTSKACCEHICESYIKSFQKLQKIIATARAGNVIGGGDYSKNRLVPDIYRAYDSKTFMTIRNPQFIRPWQHVFEPIIGYLLLAKKVYENKLTNVKPNWNFGPDNKNCKTVNFLTNRFSKKLSLKTKTLKNKKKLKENSFLKLNNKKSKKYLKWKPKWSLERSIDSIIEWNYEIKNNSVLNTCRKQIYEYLEEK